MMAHDHSAELNASADPFWSYVPKILNEPSFVPTTAFSWAVFSAAFYEQPQK